jgi:hypothetical protein
MLIDDFASSVHARSNKLDALKAVFEKAATGVEQAYLAPEANGWLALYPRQGDTAQRWAEIASRELKTVAVAFQVIEDSVFTYHFYDHGELKDAYVSRPSYFYGDQHVPEEKLKAMRGQAETWEAFLQNGRTAAELGALLKSAFDEGGSAALPSAAEYVIPSALLQEFARAVGIKGAGAAFSELEEELEEWKEDVEYADEDDEPVGARELSCGRDAASISYVRAPRKRVSSN